MKTMQKYKVGDKVTYVPFKGCDKKHYEHGIVKEIPEHTDLAIRVVYHCADDWDNYKDYTSALTLIRCIANDWI